jgi:hypothetical protein
MVGGTWDMKYKWGRERQRHAGLGACRGHSRSIRSVQEEQVNEADSDNHML